ncbi:hypothetical protein PR048_016260 [Dryococelus australis]|uniref:Uncharacterized protein n=1 Tax=Dryococelus australis TaxID=614101 RepID=A0ABQ9HJ87_9NEOP|nr:hypothetical protein PR048_016260 [Dryococelus australis]
MNSFGLCSTRNLILYLMLPTLTNVQHAQGLSTKKSNTNDTDEKKTLQMKMKRYKLRENNDNEQVLGYNCQNNIVHPKIPDQAAYYKRQLYLYNVTICEGDLLRKRPACLPIFGLKINSLKDQTKLPLVIIRGSYHVKWMGSPHISSGTFLSLGISLFHPTVIAEHCKVHHLGDCCPVQDWEKYGNEVLRQLDQWHFQFQRTKKIMVKTELVQGEQLNECECGGAKVLLAKVNDVRSLLVLHYGEQWQDNQKFNLYTKLFHHLAPLQLDDQTRGAVEEYCLHYFEINPQCDPDIVNPEWLGQMPKRHQQPMEAPRQIRCVYSIEVHSVLRYLRGKSPTLGMSYHSDDSAIIWPAPAFALSTLPPLHPLLQPLGPSTHQTLHYLHCSSFTVQTSRAATGIVISPHPPSFVCLGELPRSCRPTPPELLPRPHLPRHHPPTKGRRTANIGYCQRLTTAPFNKYVYILLWSGQAMPTTLARADTLRTRTRHTTPIRARPQAERRLENTILVCKRRRL